MYFDEFLYISVKIETQVKQMKLRQKWEEKHEGLKLRPTGRNLRPRP